MVALTKTNISLGCDQPIDPKAEEANLGSWQTSSDPKQLRTAINWLGQKPVQQTYHQGNSPKHSTSHSHTYELTHLKSCKNGNDIFSKHTSEIFTLAKGAPLAHDCSLFIKNHIKPPSNSFTHLNSTYLLKLLWLQTRIYDQHMT